MRTPVHEFDDDATREAKIRQILDRKPSRPIVVAAFLPPCTHQETEQQSEDSEALRVLREVKVEVEGEVKGGLGLDLDGLSRRKRLLDVTNNTAKDDSTIRVPKANVSLLPITPPLQAPSDPLSRSYFLKQETVRILLQKHVAKKTKRSPFKAVFRESEGGVELSRNPSASYVAGPALLATIESQETIAFPSSPEIEDTEATIKLPIAK
ncbi:hypothetical protein V5O48_005660 [Marasmius crinis-equi]|uniref:Uncharacterized protein n=1 Tax=Marasmius crinis-equi TaxID=585013 RepID=A0ABR3FMC8_9AGAR